MGATLVLLFAPAGRECSGEAEAPLVSPGEPACRDGSVVGENLAALGFLAFPIVLTLVPIVAPPELVRPARFGFAAVMIAFSVLGILSIGAFFLPAALVMVAAAWIRPWPPPPPG